MRRIDEAAKKKLIKEVPEAIEAIMFAKDQNVHTFAFMLDAFAGEPELLYNVIWLAYSEGVSVTIVPREDKS